PLWIARVLTVIGVKLIRISPKKAILLAFVILDVPCPFLETPSVKVLILSIQPRDQLARHPYLKRRLLRPPVRAPRPPHRLCRRQLSDRATWHAKPNRYNLGRTHTTLLIP